MKQNLIYLMLILITLNSCKDKPQTYYYMYDVEISPDEYNERLSGEVSELYYDNYYEVTGSDSKFSQSVADKYPCKASITISPPINNSNSNQWYEILVEYKSERGAPGNNSLFSNKFKAKIRLNQNDYFHKYELYNVSDISPLSITDSDNGKGYFNRKEFWLTAGLHRYKFDTRYTKTIQELRTKED